MKPYTVLITGARGLCGTALVTHFTSNPQKWTVFTADRKPMNSATHVRHDLRRPLPIGPDAFPEVMDFVIHAAADVDEWTDSFKVIESNVRSTFNVARYAKATGALGLVNFSSVTVYGKLGRDRVNRESNTPRPATNYGLSKLLGEQVASAVADELPVASLRPAYVLGRPLNSKTLIARLARMIARGEPVTLENGSESFLQFIDSRDIAIICERLLEARISGTFNATAPATPTIDEVFQAIANIFPKADIAVSRVAAPEKIVRNLFPADQLMEAIGPVGFREFRDSISYAVEI